MPIKMQCPGCGAALTFPDQGEGKRAKCASCQVVMVVTKQKVTAPTSESPVGGSHVADGGLMLSMLEEDRAARQKRVASGDDDLPPGLEAADSGIPDPKRLAALTVMAGGNPSLATSFKKRGKVRSNSGPSTAVGELAETLAGLVSIILSLIGFTYVTFATVNAAPEGKGWIVLTLFASLFTLFFILVVPGCLGAMKVTSLIFKFELPESPYYRMAVAVCFPAAMSTLGSNFGGQGMSILFGVGGILLTYFVLWLMFRLKPVEWIVGSILTSVAFVPLVIATVLGAGLFTTWFVVTVAKVERDVAAKDNKNPEKNPEPAPEPAAAKQDMISASEALKDIPSDAPTLSMPAGMEDKLLPEIQFGNLAIRLPAGMKLTSGGKLLIGFDHSTHTSDHEHKVISQISVDLGVQPLAVEGQKRPVVGWPQKKPATSSASYMLYTDYPNGLHGLIPFGDDSANTAIDYFRIGGMPATRLRDIRNQKAAVDSQDFYFFEGRRLLRVTITYTQENAQLVMASLATLRKVDSGEAGFGDIRSPQSLLTLANAGYTGTEWFVFRDKRFRDTVETMLKSPDEKIRALMIKWFPRAVEKEESDMLLPLLEDESIQIRRLALDQLRMSDRDRVDPITSFLILAHFPDTYLESNLEEICGEIKVPHRWSYRAEDKTLTPLKAVPAEKRAKFRDALLKAIELRPTHSLSKFAFAFACCCDANDIPMLREHYTKEATREEIKLGLMITLARLKDPKIRRDLIARLRKGDPGAFEGLVLLGEPGIETDVLNILREDNMDAAGAGIAVLSRIGTRASLPTLSAIAEGRSQYSSAARDAVDAIRERIRAVKDKNAETQPSSSTEHPTSPVPVTP